MRRKQSEDNCESEEGTTICDANLFTPYSESVKVHLSMEATKRTFELVHTKWGPFRLIPNDILDEMDQMTFTDLQYCWLEDKASEYFFSTNPHVRQFIERPMAAVIRMNSAVFEEFMEWRSSLTLI